MPRMASLSSMKDLDGAWTGHTSLWLQPGTPAFESPSTAAISTVAGDTIVTLDYAWTHEGAPQDGRILLAVNATEGVHMAWCDSFHTAADIMDLLGESTGPALTATGSYSIPGSEPWGWRIEVEPQGARRFQLRMYNILPASMGGIEALAVQADYTRA